MGRQLTDGVYITSLKQDNQAVLITGVAQSNERVSELLRNFYNNSPWLTKPELVEITAGTVALSERDQRRGSNFSKRVGLKRASDPKGPIPAAAQAWGRPSVTAAPHTAHHHPPSQPQGTAGTHDHATPDQRN